MNNREKRRMQKSLGILKHKNSLPRKDRFERMRQNIIEGKQKEQEMIEIVRVQKQGKKDEIDNNKIASKATELMIKENLSYMEALEKAKEIYKEKKKKKTNKIS